jgi:hypothetical protein
MFLNFVDLAELVSSLEPQWPLQVLVRAGVPFLALLNAYESTQFQHNDNGVRNGSTDIRLKHVSRIVDLLDCWVTGAIGQPVGSHVKAKEELTRAMESGRLTPTLCDLNSWLKLVSSSSSRARALLERLGAFENQLEFFRSGAREPFL